MYSMLVITLLFIIARQRQVYNMVHYFLSPAVPEQAPNWIVLKRPHSAFSVFQLGYEPKKNGAQNSEQVHPTQHLGAPSGCTLQSLLGIAKTLEKYTAGVPSQPYPTVYFRLCIFSCVSSPKRPPHNILTICFGTAITSLTSVSMTPTPPIVPPIAPLQCQCTVARCVMVWLWHAMTSAMALQWCVHRRCNGV